MSSDGREDIIHFRADSVRPQPEKAVFPILPIILFCLASLDIAQAVFPNSEIGICSCR